MTISLVGDGVYLVAIPFLVLSLSNVATTLSLVGVVWTVPQVILLLFAGVVSDRWDRRKVLIAADVIRAIAIGILGTLWATGGVQLWHVFVLVGAYGVGEAFFLPAFGAIVPDVVRKDLLVEANSLDQFVRPLAFRLTGPAVAGLLIATLGLGAAFLFDAATFVISAVAIVLMRARPTIGPATNHASALDELRDGFRYVRSQPWLWGGLIATAVGLLAFYGPWQVLVPFIIRNALGGDATDFGLVVAAGGAGSLLMAGLIGQLGMARRPMVYVLLTWALGTLLLAGFGLASAPWHAMLTAFVMVALLTGGQIVWVTLQHQLVPRDLLGRVSGLDWLVSTSLIPVSFGVAGPLAEIVGARQVLLGAGVMGAATLVLFILHPAIRRVNRVAGRDSTSS